MCKVQMFILLLAGLPDCFPTEHFASKPVDRLVLRSSEVSIGGYEGIYIDLVRCSVGLSTCLQV